MPPGLRYRIQHVESLEKEAMGVRGARRSVHRRWSLVLAAAGALIGACSGAPVPQRLLGETPIADLQPVRLAAGERLRVVATTSFVAEVLSQVGGGDIALTMLLPLGAEPHGYEPMPQDLRLLAEADVLFINGLGLEAFLSRTLEAAGGQAVVVSLSEGITAREASAADGRSHEEDGGEEHDPGGIDPHVWLDPLNMVRWTENAAAALAALDPAHADSYRARGAAYAARLQDLDEWIRSQVEAIPAECRLLVADHEELGYFAARYGFEIVGAVVPAYSSAAEPSAQDLANLIAAIRQHGVPAVFVSAAVNPALAARVAQDTGARLVTLYTHSLTDASGPGATYLDLMEYNVRAIVGALR